MARAGFKGLVVGIALACLLALLACWFFQDPEPGLRGEAALIFGANPEKTLGQLRKAVLTVAAVLPLFGYLIGLRLAGPPTESL